MGADYAGPLREVGLLDARAVDANAGDTRRVGGAEGGLDGVAGPRDGFGGGGVGAVSDVRQRLQEDPVGGGCIRAARERRGPAGGGEKLEN